MKPHTLLLLLSLMIFPSTFAQSPTKAEVDSALAFLYRYMPAPDRAMYPEAFWRANVQASLRARSEMPWGKEVPEREWKHFVLPVRVNNENLDLSRPAFYAELKDRVKSLSMTEAILEVNHWCHEKVTYRPSDARTSSPLSSVSQAIGRCGEESTFAVAALRSVGIPARQVYTPRWAHTDDNHAWVEAFADGRWHFLGACEPEPILDLAWFNQPAGRGMMMHTNVFGDYNGSEEVMDRNAHYTTINVTENYAPTALTTVTVTDTEGRPVKDAAVKFMVYNYAEYYPISAKVSDEQGHASLRTGKGDMIVWAAHNGRFGLTRTTAGEEITVILDNDASTRRTLEFDLTPPPTGARLPQVTAAQRAENNRRLSQEDSIREAYMATFATSEQARDLSRRLSLAADKVQKVLAESRGNHKMIERWLDSIPAAEREKGLALLLSMSEKDRRDVSREVLDDHLANTPAAKKEYAALWEEYVLNPRVENEALTPYKAFFQSLADAAADCCSRNPQAWLEMLRGHIRHDSTTNPKQLRITPQAAWESGSADALGASICFVACMRSFGIPARIDPITGKTQYALADGSWQDVDIFATSADTPASKPHTAILTACEVESPLVAEPRYYSHFSLSQIGTDGLLRQMEYPEGITLQQWLASPPRLDAGQYILTTGQRLANGGVLARSEIFTVTPRDKEVSVPVVMRRDDRELQVIGSLDAETLYTPLGTSQQTSLLQTSGRGYYVIGLIAAGHEPSVHVLNDISAIASALNQRPEQIILLFEDADAAKRFNASAFRLPANVHLGIDTDSAVAGQLTASMHLSEPLSLPLVAIADSFGRVVWVSEGYTIGLGESLLQLLNRLRGCSCA